MTGIRTVPDAPFPFTSLSRCGPFKSAHLASESGWIFRDSSKPSPGLDLHFSEASATPGSRGVRTPCVKEDRIVGFWPALSIICVEPGHKPASLEGSVQK